MKYILFAFLTVFLVCRQAKVGSPHSVQTINRTGHLVGMPHWGLMVLCIQPLALLGHEHVSRSQYAQLSSPRSKVWDLTVTGRTGLGFLLGTLSRELICLKDNCCSTQQRLFSDCFCRRILCNRWSEMDLHSTLCLIKWKRHLSFKIHFKHFFFVVV